MQARQQLAKVIDVLLTSEDNIETGVEKSTIKEYQELNDKCDVVIDKIKNRKKKKTTKRMEE